MTTFLIWYKQLKIFICFQSQMGINISNTFIFNNIIQQYTQKNPTIFVSSESFPASFLPKATFCINLSGAGTR